MSMLVDTSVWSLALRRDSEQAEPEVAALRDALLGADEVFTTGLIVQELRHGSGDPRARSALVEQSPALACLRPGRQDDIKVADVRDARRRPRVEIGTIDAFPIRGCRRHEVVVRSTVRDVRSTVRDVRSTVRDVRSAATHGDFGRWGAL